MGELLDRQYKYFLLNKEGLLEKYEGKFVVIHDEKLIDVFDTERDAYIYCVQHFKIGTFFMQQVISESSKKS